MDAVRGGYAGMCMVWTVVGGLYKYVHGVACCVLYEYVYGVACCVRVGCG